MIEATFGEIQEFNFRHMNLEMTVKYLSDDGKRSMWYHIWMLMKFFSVTKSLMAIFNKITSKQKGCLFKELRNMWNLITGNRAVLHGIMKYGVSAHCLSLFLEPQDLACNS